MKRLNFTGDVLAFMDSHCEVRGQALFGNLLGDSFLFFFCIGSGDNQLSFCGGVVGATVGLPDDLASLSGGVWLGRATGRSHPRGPQDGAPILHLNSCAVCFACVEVFSNQRSLSMSPPARC